MSEQTEPSDSELMRELRDGRDGALSELISRWREPLFSFAYRYVQNTADADEVSQETFVKVYQHRDRYRLDARFSTWLFAITVNLCRNRARWKRRHPTVSLDGAMDDSDGKAERWSEDVDTASPEEEAARKERAAAVREEIAKLPHDLKTALLLFQYEGLSHQEIGEVLGCTPKAVETRIYRARRRLKKKLRWLLEDEAGVRPAAQRA